MEANMRNYEMPNLEIIAFDCEDVITSSNEMPIVPAEGA